MNRFFTQVNSFIGSVDNSFLITSKIFFSFRLLLLPRRGNSRKILICASNYLHSRANDVTDCFTWLISESFSLNWSIFSYVSPTAALLHLRASVVLMLLHSLNYFFVNFLPFSLARRLRKRSRRCTSHASSIGYIFLTAKADCCVLRKLRFQPNIKVDRWTVGQLFLAREAIVRVTPSQFA